MRLNATEKNAKNAVEYLLWASKVKLSSSAIKEELCLHPDFPSIAAVSDALFEWKVPNMATRLHPEQIKEIPLPALAYLRIRGGILAPIKSVKNDSHHLARYAKGLANRGNCQFSTKMGWYHPVDRTKRAVWRD